MMVLLMDPLLVPLLDLLLLLKKQLLLPTSLAPKVWSRSSLPLVPWSSGFVPHLLHLIPREEYEESTCALG